VAGQHRHLSTEVVQSAAEHCWNGQATSIRHALKHFEAKGVPQMAVRWVLMAGAAAAETTAVVIDTHERVAGVGAETRSHE